MSDKRDLVKRHLQELKARRKSDDFQSLKTRILGERLIRTVLDSLKEYGIYYEEILSIDVEASRPDFILMKLDVSIPVYFKTVGEQFSLNNNDITHFVNVFSEQDYSYIIICWINEESLVAISLTLDTLTKMSNNIYYFNTYSDFKTLVLDIFEKEVPTLTILPLEIKEKYEMRHTRKKMEETCKELVINNLNSRKPQLEYKKLSLNMISLNEVDDICTKMTDYYENKIELKDFLRYLNPNSGG